MDDSQRLVHLVKCGHTCINIVTHDEIYALTLARDLAIDLKRPLWLWSISKGVHDGLVADAAPLPETENAAAALWFLSRLPNQPLAAMLDLCGHLRDERTLRLLRDLLEGYERNGGQIILIDHRDEMPPVIAEAITRFEIPLPKPAEVEQLVRETLRQAHRERAIEVDLKRREWNVIVRNLCGLTRRQIHQIVTDAIADDRRFDANDINGILAAKRQALHAGSLLEYVKTPVDLDEIGGLERLKHWLALRQNALTDEAAAFGISKPRGVLLLGVQGAGKSLCAKAIATAWHRPLLRMDVGALYDRYVGESERRLRDALCQAERMAPVVLWIDEIEKAFASAASRSTDGGLSQRMFGTLLTWMQEHEAAVFLVATANDIEALPPELLRKGRFDEIFFVDLPREATRRAIFEIHLRKRHRDPARYDVAALAAAADGFSGAEIEQAIVAAMHEAYGEHAEVDTGRILKALRQSPPLSVTMAERVAALREWADGRCVPVD